MALSKVEESHLRTLEKANEQLFYGYHWSKGDQSKLNDAIEYYTTVRDRLERSLENE